MKYFFKKQDTIAWNKNIWILSMNRGGFLNSLFQLSSIFLEVEFYFFFFIIFFIIIFLDSLGSGVGVAMGVVLSAPLAFDSAPLDVVSAPLAVVSSAAPASGVTSAGFSDLAVVSS